MAPGWERDFGCVRSSTVFALFHSINFITRSVEQEGNLLYFTKPLMNSRASFRRTSYGLSFLDLRDSFISSSVWNIKVSKVLQIISEVENLFRETKLTSSPKQTGELPSAAGRDLFSFEDFSLEK